MGLHPHNKFIEYPDFADSQVADDSEVETRFEVSLLTTSAVSSDDRFDRSIYKSVFSGIY
jgi:hypothetical protein